MMVPMSTSRPDEDLVRRATDWRSQVRLVGRPDSAWSVPVVDLVLAAACLYATIVAASFLTRFGLHTVYVLDVLMALALTVAQLLRHRALRTSLVLTGASLSVYSLLMLLSPVSLGVSPLSLTALTGVHAAVRWCEDPRWRHGAVVAAMAGSAINPVTMLLLGRNRISSRFIQVQGSGAVVLLTCLGAALISALAVAVTASDARQRRRLAEEHLRLVSRERAAAAAAERLDLARELHDLVGHTLTAIKVQSATALSLGDAGVQREALVDIERTANAGLEEVRDLVRVLRGSARAGHPVRTVADLEGVSRAIEASLASGLDLRVRAPDERELAEATTSWSLLQRLALLRTVQEGLTNALRHGTGSAELRLDLQPGRCHVRVTNPIAAASAGSAFGGGAGLAGLAERVALVGGSVTAHAVPGDGPAPIFELDVVIPTAASGTQEDHHDGQT